MSQIRPFIRLHNIKHVESQNIDNILGVYFMDKKRVLFGFGIFAMLVIFTVLNIIIGRYYYDDKQIVEKKDDTAVTSAGISANKKSDSKIPEIDEKQTISFQDYQKFYEYLSDNFKLKGYEKKYSTRHDYIVFIEPIWAFNTRDRLLLPDPNDIPHPTQEYMLFENKESTCQITVAVCFNEHYIGNNLHSFLSSDSDLRNINHKLGSNAIGALMSYQNILFHIQISRTRKDNYVLGDVLKELSNKVSGYFEK